MITTINSMSRNKLSIITIIMILSSLLPAMAEEPEVLKLDLESAIAIALADNPIIKVADMEIEKKQYGKKSAYGALLPQIDLIGQYQHTLKRQTMYLDGAFDLFGDIDYTKFDPEDLKILEVLGKAMAPSDDADSNEGIQVGRKNMWSTGVNVSLPLVVPSLWKNIRMSKIDLELSLEKSRSSKIDLTNQVKKAFYSILLAQDSYNVFKETYTTDSINLENIRAKLEQGVVAEYDLITAEVRLKGIIPNILQAENMLKIAEMQLKMFMGVDADLPIEVEGALTDFEKGMFATIIPADESLSSNSDLRQFDLQTEQVATAIDLQRMQMLPVLTSSFNYIYISQNNDFKFKDYRWDPYSVVGITLAVPLFNGGQRYNTVQQSKIQLMQLKEQRYNVERGLKLSVKNSIELINKNIEQVKATESAVEMARKGYEITQKRYETGMGTIVDLNAAALAVTSTELQYRNAIYDYLSAKADLEKILGYDID